MILLLFYLCIRGGELLNIRIQDVDFSTNRISIVRRADERALEPMSLMPKPENDSTVG